MKVWFDSKKNELLQIKEIEEEYDSSRERWEFYNKVYKDVFPKIEHAELSPSNNGERYFKELDGIKFGGEVDFNFSSNGRYNKINYFTKIVNHDEDIEENKKEEIEDIIKKLGNRHYSEENVSIMPSNGNIQGAKQHIGNDRFDVMIYAIDEYCKGNTALLLVRCTPENQRTLHSSIEKICSGKEDKALNSRLYYKKIYRIEDEQLIKDLIESGKKAIDSTERVLEYAMLAYRVWIARAKQSPNIKEDVEKLQSEYEAVKKVYHEIKKKE